VVSPWARPRALPLLRETGGGSVVSFCSDGMRLVFVGGSARPKSSGFQQAVGECLMRVRKPGLQGRLDEA
jgi:hypothetical protein